MMNDPVFNHLRETSWRRPLTASEEEQLRAWLGEHPERQSEWETEQRLNEAMARLPDAPLASNFTARVLAAVELEQRAEDRRGRSRTRPHWLRWLLPRVAMAGVVGSAGFFGYKELHAAHLRSQIKESVVEISAVKSLPSVEALEDFDAIRALDNGPGADEKLLSLLQ